MSGSSLSRIMMVEDDPDIRQIAGMSLEAVGGFKVRACEGGREALAAVHDFEPELILLDVMMPEMDGPTTLRALRELDVSATTPIVFMTAKVQPQEKAEYLELGAVEVIAKPFDPMTLPEQIRTIWNRVVETA